MASVPSYALAGMLKGRRQSSEAALKYAVYGAGAAGVMLYGISLLAGVLGTCHLPTMAVQLAELIAAEQLAATATWCWSLGGLMVGVGLAFKLSAVPFHFWCPDVFEGASAEVNAFLSVASKAAALALLVRVVLGFGTRRSARPRTLAHGRAARCSRGAGSTLAGDARSAAAATRRAGGTRPRWQPVRGFLVGLDRRSWPPSPARSATWRPTVRRTSSGCLAYSHDRPRRLHDDAGRRRRGAGRHATPPMPSGPSPRLCFYAGVYLFMNLGAFAIVAFLRNELRSEEIADYAGLIHRSPGVVICLSLICLSLLGLPPLAGLWAKVYIFAAMIDAAKIMPAMWVLIAVAGLNAVLSLFYYLRVVKVMILDPPPVDAPESRVPMGSTGRTVHAGHHAARRDSGNLLEWVERVGRGRGQQVVLRISNRRSQISNLL